MEISRRRAAWAAFLMLAGGSGCWEEVRFTPLPEITTAADAASPPAETPPPDAVVLEEPAASPLPSEPVVLEAPATELPPSDEPVTLPDPPAAAPPAPIESTAPAPAAPTSTPPTTSDERRQAWRAASQWSLAAAMYAKGLEASRYDPVLAEAKGAAAAIGLELPPLPAGAADAAREQAAIDSLRDDAGPALAEMIGKRYGAAEQAAARLAIQSRLWLLTYTPRSNAVSAEAAAAREAGVTSGLPAELWAPLVQLVEARAEFLAVRQAVFDMDRRVEAHLKTAP